MDEPSLRRENRLVRCSVERREMLTGRKSGGRRVALFVCIERRIVKIVRRAASSQGVFVWGRKSGERLGPGIGSGCHAADSCPPQKGRIALHMTY